MQSLKKRSPFTLDKNLYQISNPLFITSNKFWDGGIYPEDSLETKSEFYATTAKMSDFIKKLVLTLDETIYVSEHYCEHNQLYAQWSDLKKHEIFRSVSAIIKKKQFYQLTLPEDANIVDMIIESNFRYLTHISFYLPKNNIIVQPTCHTEIIIYSFNYEKILGILTAIAEYFPDLSLEY